MSPDFNKGLFSILHILLILCSYSQIENQEGYEVPISFISFAMQGSELKYPKVDKNAFTIFKEIKHFRTYLLKSQTKVIVPCPTTKYLLVQKELGDLRANWMTTLQEYDLEVKMEINVKGQGLFKLATKSKYSYGKEEEGWEKEVDMTKKEVDYIPILTNS
jgi:hypothetical protein